MRRWLIGLAVLLGSYLVSGFFVVKGNEKAAVRRFGRVLRNDADNVALEGSGLHYDLPWPFATVDRINLNEIRTLTIGTTELDEVEGNMAGFLRSAAAISQSQFLTGDKNILNLQVSVQYRISERNPYDFLYRSESAERHLKLLVESAVADLVSRSGVDFVHPLGLVELREMLTIRSRQLAAQYRLGVEVEEVAISSVYPPPQVKRAFLDVSDARAAKAKSVNDARAYAEQQRARVDGEAQQIDDEAQMYRQRLVEEARGAADRFTKIVAQFEQQQARGIQAARTMTMRRLYIDTMDEILRKVDGKVLLDSGMSVDLTIFRDPKQ